MNAPPWAEGGIKPAKSGDIVVLEHQGKVLVAMMNWMMSDGTFEVIWGDTVMQLSRQDAFSRMAVVHTWEVPPEAGSLIGRAFDSHAECKAAFYALKKGIK